MKSVLNNGTMIDFATTAGGVRNTFKTELHYWNFAEGKQMANTRDPQIPAALANVVAGIKGLSPVPARPAHTPVRPIQYDAETHNWHNVAAPSKDGIQPAYLDPNGNYVETPQDLYTIYNVNPILKGGNLGKGATVAIPEPSDIDFGTVDSTGHASGGVVANFRKNFGVAGTLNFVVMHEAGTVTCGDPGQLTGFETEASLDADWANALAPAAELLLMSCDDTGAAGDGLTTAEMALVDDNLSDVISVSYDGPETTTSDYTFDDQLYTQAASQGQTFIVAAGDSGADTADQNTGMPAVSGYTSAGSLPARWSLRRGERISPTSMTKTRAVPRGAPTGPQSTPSSTAMLLAISPKPSGTRAVPAASLRKTLQTRHRLVTVRAYHRRLTPRLAVVVV